MATNEEKVEMADVPKEAENEKTQEETPAAVKKPKKSLFSNLFAKKEKQDALLGGEETTDAEKENAKSPVKKWLSCPFKQYHHATEATDMCSPMTTGVNLLDRDEKMINEHIKLTFEDILAEPDGYHSCDWVWRSTHATFTGFRTFIYRLLSFVLAIPLAIFWAVIFALLTCLNVWLLTPLARALSIPAFWLAKAWQFLIQSIFDPLFRSCSLCCGRRCDIPMGFYRPAEAMA